MRISIQSSIQITWDGVTEETLSSFRPYAWADEGTLYLTTERVREAFGEDHGLWEQAEFALNQQVRQIYDFLFHEQPDIDGDIILEK